MKKTIILKEAVIEEIRGFVDFLLRYKNYDDCLLSSRIEKVISEFKEKTGQDITNVDISTMFTLIELSESYFKEDDEIIDDDVDFTFFMHNIFITCIAEYLVDYFKELGYNYSFDDIYEIDSSGYDIYKIKSSDNKDINCLEMDIKGYLNGKYTFSITEEDCKTNESLKVKLDDFAKYVDNCEHKNKVN